MSATRPARLLLLASVPLALAASIRGAAVDQPPVTTPAAAPAPQPAYVGSDACQSCHEAEHAQWKRSLHVRMTKPIDEALVAGDFDATLEAGGRTYTMAVRDGRRVVAVARGAQPAESFDVHYTLGAGQFQGYLSRLPDGRIYVLPVFWSVADRRWIDWKQITPVPEGEHDLRQIWNVNCVNCHATNLEKNYDAATNTYRTAWTEMGLGCETCHGPGRPHVELMREWERDPATRPAYDASSRNRQLGSILRIFSPRSADRRQVFDTCAYCHGNKVNYFFGFAAGDRYEDFASPFLLSQPLPESDQQGEFWPDGRPSRFNRPQALMQSGCFDRSEITCTNCHVAHGSRNAHSLKVGVRDAMGAITAQSDALCTQCHTRLTVDSRQSTADSRQSRTDGGLSRSSSLSTVDRQLLTSLSEHTRHPDDSPGSRCVECHMSDVNWRLLIRRRDHTFAAPVPELTARYGIPNACTTCHDARTPEWAAGVMDRWYGDAERRQAAVRRADILYAAGAGEPAALPGLARLAVDRSESAVIRASAAEFIGRLAAGGMLPESSRGESQTQYEAARGQASRTGSAGAGLKPGSTKPGDTAPSPVVSAPPPEGAPRSAAPPGPAPDLVAPPSGAARLTPAIVNALIGAAADPEPVVRAAAVRALGAAGERRAMSPLAARLVDRVRVVRVNAADALLSLGVWSLDGHAGAALARALEEHAASLRTFSDQAGKQAALGWLDMNRGRTGEAARALDLARRIDPSDPRPLVYQGIMAARESRYDAAIRLWRDARQRDPQYPNIDRLIAEAEKRRRP
jgi:tetratricopeptide (TPR) repeat protein